MIFQSEDKIYLFLANIVKQIKKCEHDDNFREVLLDQFSLKKTTSFLKDHLAEMLYKSIADNHDCYFKATAIVGIIREYINTDVNIYIYSDRKIQNLVEDILLICKYSVEDINKIIHKLN